MNKQEAIEKIEKEKSTLNGWEELTRNNALDAALTIVRKLDEPEKPVVPHFVADWYEEHKDNFEDSIQSLCVHGCLPKRQIDTWFDNDDNKPIETLVKMRLYGYERREYKVALKSNGFYLGIHQEDGQMKTVFTRNELAEYGFNNLDEYEVTEVDNE